MRKSKSWGLILLALGLLLTSTCQLPLGSPSQKRKRIVNLFSMNILSKKIIILYHPRTLHEDAYKYFYVPYSLLSISSVIDQSKYQIILIDANVREISDWDLQNLLFTDRVVCVGINSMIGHQIRGAISFSARVKYFNPKTPVIWGGALPTILPQLTLENQNIDFICMGQGQVAFPKLIETILTGGDLNVIEGIGYKNDEKINLTARSGSVDWNIIPYFKDVYNLIDVKDYIRNDEHINNKTINYHSSLGCPFNCGFCSEVSLWERKWSGFSDTIIVNDVEYLIQKFGINGIKFYDAEFFINQNRVISFANSLIERKINIKWAAAIHPLNFSKISTTDLKILANSGLRRLLMGAESGNQEELELIGKKISPASVLEMAKRCTEFGIIGCFSFVTGYPGFPTKYIDRTLEFAQSIREIDENHECKVHLFGPYPGTPLYQRAIEYGFIPPKNLTEWSFYDYYKKTTPWVDETYEIKVRNFNIENYLYMNTNEDISNISDHEY